MPSDVGHRGPAAPDAGTERGTGRRRRFGHLEAVAGQVHSCRYSAVSERSTFGPSGRWLHQMAWDLEGAEVELIVEPLNSTASGVG